MSESDLVYHSLSPKGSMSRQGSIFYDALEPLASLMINGEQDELGKLVSKKKEQSLTSITHYIP